MRGIILAAGQGVRLAGTSVEPKCLVEIGGSTLLQRQILALQSANVTDIVIVVGYEAARIKEVCAEDISFVENPDFARTSSLYSLWLAKDYLADGFVVLNSDVLFHPQILNDLLEFQEEDALLISYCGPTSDPLGDEEMKVKVNAGLVADISKNMNLLEAHGENVGIVKFGAQGAKILINHLELLVTDGAARDWAPRAFREFASHRPLHAVGTRGYPWIEIDFPADYEKAVREIYPKIASLATPPEQEFMCLGESNSASDV
jgi:choline kinase